MVHEEKKVAKIIEELTIFFFAAGANHLQSGIEREGKEVIISFKSDYQPEHREMLHSLNDYLNGQKNVGVEDIYWGLAGSGDPGETSQLLLVGMMIDKADITVADKYVELKLYKRLL